MKKILSMVMVLMLIISAFSVAAISAETEETFTPSEEPTIYFEVPEDWANFKKVFCHIWAYGSDTPLANWQAKKEACTLVEDRTYSYDISKVGGLEAGVTYCVIFSLDTAQETYTTLMSTDCYGDTLYCDDTYYENPVDSNKTSRAAFWKNHDSAEFGPLMQFTSLGNLVGTCMAPGATTESLIIDFITNGTLANAVEFSGKTEEEILSGIAAALGITDEELADIIATIPSTDDEIPEESAPEESIPEETTPDEAPEEEEILYLGDANGDATVNVKDATLIQKHVAGFTVSINLTSADVDYNTIVNVKDATAIQKFVAGMQVNTPIGDAFTPVKVA